MLCLGHQGPLFPHAQSRNQAAVPPRPQECTPGVGWEPPVSMGPAPPFHSPQHVFSLPTHQADKREHGDAGSCRYQRRRQNWIMCPFILSEFLTVVGATCVVLGAWLTAGFPPCGCKVGFQRCGLLGWEDLIR